MAISESLHSRNMRADGGKFHASEQAASRVEQTMGKFSEAAHPAVDQISQRMHGAIDRLGSFAVKATENIFVTGERLYDLEGRTVEVVRKVVRTKPVAALGIAMAVGVIASRLLARNRSDY